MTAEGIAKAIGARKVGAGWMARCPAHDREPSLSICQGEDGKALVRSHAGCEQAKVIAVLRSRGRLWQGSHRRRFGQPSSRPTNRALTRDTERSEAALAIWMPRVPRMARLSKLISPRVVCTFHYCRRCDRVGQEIRGCL
jgi:putative DNA primase/helicase